MSRDDHRQSSLRHQLHWGTGPGRNHQHSAAEILPISWPASGLHSWADERFRALSSEVKGCDPHRVNHLRVTPQPEEVRSCLVECISSSITSHDGSTLFSIMPSVRSIEFTLFPVSLCRTLFN